MTQVAQSMRYVAQSTYYVPLPGRPRDAHILNEYVLCAPIAVLDRKLRSGDMVHAKRRGKHIVRTVVRTPKGLMLRHGRLADVPLSSVEPVGIVTATGRTRRV
jgi:hypothetical protein